MYPYPTTHLLFSQGRPDQRLPSSAPKSEKYITRMTTTDTSISARCSRINQNPSPRGHKQCEAVDDHVGN